MKRNKICMNAALLRQALIKWRQLTTSRKLAVTLPSALCPSRCRSFLCKPNQLPDVPKDVPPGHLAVYVGTNCKRFVIRATNLNHPVFRALLDKAEEEYGFHSCRRLVIPCDERFFEHLLHLLHRNDRMLSDLNSEVLLHQIVNYETGRVQSQRNRAKGSNNCEENLSLMILHSLEKQLCG